MAYESCSIQSLFFYPDFDRNDRIKLSAVLRNFQQVSGAHVELTGTTTAEIYQKTGKVYIVAGYEADILRRPHPGSIEVRTWIEGFRRRIYTVRRYEIVQDGEVVICGAGLWFMYDPVTRFPVRNHLEIVDLPACPSDPEAPYDMAELQLPSQMQQTDTGRVMFIQCDGNNHLNNTYYPDFCQQITRDREVVGFRIAYKRECAENEEILLTAQTCGEKTYVRGLHQDESTAFEAELIINTSDLEESR